MNKLRTSSPAVLPQAFSLSSDKENRGVYATKQTNLVLCRLEQQQYPAVPAWKGLFLRWSCRLTPSCLYSLYSYNSVDSMNRTNSALLCPPYTSPKKEGDKKYPRSPNKELPPHKSPNTQTPQTTTVKCQKPKVNLSALVHNWRHLMNTHNPKTATLPSPCHCFQWALRVVALTLPMKTGFTEVPAPSKNKAD